MAGVPDSAITGAPHGVAGVVDRTRTAARHGVLGVALRVGAMTVAAVAVAWLHRVNDPGVLCPMRALTGIPCPLCGGTTVFIELGSGHPVRAAAANPAVLVAAVALATAPLGPGGRWWALRPKTRAWMLGAALAASELWQLARFDLLRM
ncbi:Protein of unknown function [Thermomonospora echinospora]|uniref:DUF2752 domain-containing protein n=1 Tax=Thermomonospora echinospora TaxID=1992 RepID=A0A1H6CEJ8_9ACTN|nr:DUF2752 domain-containing protein [Thermomonospora echinospora]SEG71217.1 Protein of unknown function [Thermomonospora echinospora]